MILNTDPGRLRRRVGDPREREHLAVARADHRDAAEAPGERLDRRALDVGVDRRADRAAAARLDGGEHAVAGAQLAARRAGELCVELPLQAGQADRRARRDAAALQLRRALGRRRADAAGDLRRERAEVGEPRLPLGERRAVARLDRGARRHASCSASASRRAAAPGGRGCGAQSMPAPASPSPSTTGSASWPESVPKMRVRSATGTLTTPSAGSAGAPGGDARERRDLGGLAVGGGEALERDPALVLGREPRVHGRVVAAPSRSRSPVRPCGAGRRRPGRRRRRRRTRAARRRRAGRAGPMRPVAGAGGALVRTDSGGGAAPGAGWCGHGGVRAILTRTAAGMPAC